MAYSLIRKLTALCVALVVAALAGGLAPQARAQSYGIMPGDTLRIEVLEDSTLDRNALVLPDGTITFPMAGTLRVAGRSPESVRQSIVKSISKDFAAPPTVYVSVMSVSDETLFDPRVIDVYVMGEVATPGKIELEPGTTLLQALAQGGGFTRFAALKRIELRRADPSTGTEHIYVFNYKTGAGIPGSTALQNGDVIVVPERKLFE